MRRPVLAAAAAAALLLLPAAQAGPIGIGFGDVQGEYLALSMFGHAAGDEFLAASGTGDASCGSMCLALSLAGNAYAGGCFIFCTGAAVSGTGDSWAGLVAASGAGDATGLYAASLAGDSRACRVALSVGGDAQACHSHYCGPNPLGACNKNLALSAFGDAEGDIALSVTGKAHGGTASLSGCRLFGLCPPLPPEGPRPGA